MLSYLRAVTTMEGGSISWVLSTKQGTFRWFSSRKDSTHGFAEMARQRCAILMAFHSYRLSFMLSGFHGSYQNRRQRETPNNRFERSRVAPSMGQGGESMIGMYQLRWSATHSRVAQPHR